MKTAPISKDDHRALALWAADCAEHVLALFEEHRVRDDRPRKAVEAARAWVRGEVRVREARAAASAAHAAARDAEHPAARAAARAAGHAAATAHMPAHARHAADYAVTAAMAGATVAAGSGVAGAPAPEFPAASAADDPAVIAARERAWQCARLPEHLRPTTEVE